MIMDCMAPCDLYSARQMGMKLPMLQDREDSYEEAE